MSLNCAGGSFDRLSVFAKFGRDSRDAVNDEKLPRPLFAFFVGETGGSRYLGDLGDGIGKASSSTTASSVSPTVYDWFSLLGD